MLTRTPSRTKKIRTPPLTSHASALGRYLGPSPPTDPCPDLAPPRCPAFHAVCTAHHSAARSQTACAPRIFARLGIAITVQHRNRCLTASIPSQTLNAAGQPINGLFQHYLRIAGARTASVRDLGPRVRGFPGFP